MTAMGGASGSPARDSAASRESRAQRGSGSLRPRRPEGERHNRHWGCLFGEGGRTADEEEAASRFRSLARARASGALSRPSTAPPAGTVRF